MDGCPGSHQRFCSVFLAVAQEFRPDLFVFVGEGFFEGILVDWGCAWGLLAAVGVFWETREGVHGSRTPCGKTSLT